MMEELKPCPFCDKIPSIESYSINGETYYQFLHHCGAVKITASNFSKQELKRKIVAWNTRILIANPLAFLDEPRAVEAVTRAITDSENTKYPMLDFRARKFAKAATEAVKRLAKEGE